MEQNQLEGKIEQERGFLDKVLDGAGAAIGTSYLTRAMLSGTSPYGAVVAYGIPYLGFKAVKGAYNFIRHPVKSLSLDGIGRGIYDLYHNLIPYRERVPASIGAISSGVNYAGTNLAAFLV